MSAQRAEHGEATRMFASNSFVIRFSWVVRREEQINAPDKWSIFVPASFRLFGPINSRQRLAGMLLAFNKPYGVLSQFTPDGSPNRPLSEFGFPKGVYPIGRLDADSEGLLLLSDEADLNQRLLHPARGHSRTYW